MDTSPDDPALLVWEARHTHRIAADPLWRLAAYRHAAFLASLVREDARRLSAIPHFTDVARQLLTSVASVAANIAEGYGRPTTADRIRFMNFAMGSARECEVWLEAAEGGIPEADRDDRLERIARVRRILFGLIKRLRSKAGKTPDGW